MQVEAREYLENFDNLRKGLERDHRSIDLHFGWQRFEHPNNQTMGPQKVREIQQLQERVPDFTPVLAELVFSPFNPFQEGVIHHE